MTHATIATHVAGELRAEAARLKYSNARLAQETGLSEFAISRRLSGVAKTDYDELYAICAVLEVDPLHVLSAAASRSRIAVDAHAQQSAPSMHVTGGTGPSVDTVTSGKPSAFTTGARLVKPGASRYGTYATAA